MTGEVSGNSKDIFKTPELLLNPRDINRATLMVLSNYSPKPVNVFL